MIENFIVMLILFILLQIAEYMEQLNTHSDDSRMWTCNEKKKTFQKAIPSILIAEWFSKNASLLV